MMLGLVALVAVSCDKDPVMIEVPVQLAMDGKPFFWLGDTAWLLFSAISREEAFSINRVHVLPAGVENG